MVRVDAAKWGQTPDELRRAAVQASHPRTRERFQALSLIAAGPFNATGRAAHPGRDDETAPGWVRWYNGGGPDAVADRRTGGRAPLLRRRRRRRGSSRSSSRRGRPTTGGPATGGRGRNARRGLAKRAVARPAGAPCAACCGGRS